MSDDPLDGMRRRIETCRRLARQILDRQAADALLQMAEEIEIDLAKLEAGRAERSGPSEPNPMPLPFRHGGCAANPVIGRAPSRTIAAIPNR